MTRHTAPCGMEGGIGHRLPIAFGACFLGLLLLFPASGATAEVNGPPMVASTGCGVQSTSAINLALQHVALIRGTDQVVRIYVDGILRFTETSTGNAGHGDSSRGFVAGGEFTFHPVDRWLGERHLVAVCNRDLTASEVFRNLAAGPEPILLVAEVEVVLPTALLGLVSPNPFKAQVTFEVTLPEATPLNLIVYNQRGRQVRRFTSGMTLGDGPRTITWDGSDDKGRKCVSGTYFVRAWTADDVDIRRISLVK